MREGAPQLSAAQQALTDIMASYRYEMTAFEGKAWNAIITSVPEDRFLSFLSHFYATSTFPPRPSDASSFLDLSINPDVACTKLERLIQELGPYQEPALDDDPILVTTILNMGGWVAVNERMPDRSLTHEVRQFRDRFNANFTQALVQVRIAKQLPTERLVAIGGSAAPRVAIAAPAGTPSLPSPTRADPGTSNHAAVQQERPSR